MSEQQNNQETQLNTPNNNTPELKGNVKILKDAFPDLEVDLIETILESQGGNLDAAFEVLLGMSDPSYKPEPTNDQLREDEAYARRLARESQPRQNSSSQDRPNDQNPLFNFQEELPVIKEKVIEAGNAAKNKIMSFYNQLMASPDNNQQASNSNAQNSNLLETKMGGLNLMDNSTQNRTENKRSVDLYEWDGRATNNTAKERNINTSTPQDQLLSDEQFARQLAKEDADMAAAAAVTVTTPRSPDTGIFLLTLYTV
ncbi:hypothetical protein BY458DRAFT_528672 [Sporodiniella umbellata]|nr:hypothetical protein BY458DRAFT_528672 [Sporodiniella umbellata]